MGNRKLRLSNIIPNGWLYKLKEMRITPKSTLTQTLPDEEDSVQVQPPPRKSYHLSRKRIPTTKKTPNSTPTPSSATKSSSSSSSSVSAACSCGSTSTATIQSTLRSKPISSHLQESASFDQMLAWSSTSCNCSSNSPLPDDDDDYVKPRVGLPPIRTEHKKFSDLVREIGQVEEELLLVDNQIKQRQDHVISRSPARRRLRINSPKLSRRVENNAGRKSVRRKKRIEKESVAMVKSSSDPERDFRESMMEMIVENEMREAKELEELLACYLSLNSMEYHHLIVHVFQQIWFDLNRIPR